MRPIYFACSRTKLSFQRKLFVSHFLFSKFLHWPQNTYFHKTISLYLKDVFTHSVYPPIIYNGAFFHIIAMLMVWITAIVGCKPILCIFIDTMPTEKWCVTNNGLKTPRVSTPSMTSLTTVDLILKNLAATALFFGKKVVSLDVIFLFMAFEISRRDKCRTLSDLLFARWEVDELHSWVTETLDLREFLSSPKRDTLLMERGKVRSLWWPTNVCLRPSLRFTTLHDSEQSIPCKISKVFKIRITSSSFLWKSFSFFPSIFLKEIGW